MAELIRKIVGNTEPRQALPGTIRGDFASIESYAVADEKKRVIKNLIHASDSEENGKRENQEISTSVPIAWPGRPLSKRASTAPLFPCALLILPTIFLPVDVVQHTFLPITPFARVKITSAVGLPRESRISRALMDLILGIVKKFLIINFQFSFNF